MSRIIFLLTVFLLTKASTAAQDKAEAEMPSSRYETGMQKAFALWEEGKHWEAANAFERIAGAETENWIPYYYVVHINTVYSFGEKNEEKLSLQLEKAGDFLDKAKMISPDNPELLVLEALINTVWVSYDGQKYGMALSAKNTQLYKKALQLAPDNPRVVLSKAEWDMGGARFFGQDPNEFCKDVEKASELFGTFKSDIPFYPKWGKDRAEQILENCKNRD